MKALGATVAAFVLGLAAAVNAATVSQTFTFTGNGTATQSSFEMTSGEVTLTLGAALYNTPGLVGTDLVTTNALKLTRSNGYGLYVVNTVNNGSSWSDNDHRIDGFYNEIVTFAFDKAVRITGVTFKEVLSGSVFDLYVNDLGGTPDYKGSQLVDNSLDLPAGTGTLFGIGASQDGEKSVCVKWKHDKCKAWKKYDVWSGFKITSLTVEYDEPVTTVPLPAGGMLLLAGLGALAVLRKRKTA
jgi:Ca2+-binding RTX toxin-like protein